MVSRPGPHVRARCLRGDRTYSGDEDAARVQFDLEETLDGTRLVVTETRPLEALELEIPGGPVMLAHA